MADGDLHEQISRLELEIEELTATGQRCRKIAQASTVVMVIGVVWLLAMIVGAVRLDPMALVGGIATIIGGIVVFGSNTSTARQIAARIESAEALRAELINRIEFRVVSDQGRVLE